MGPTTRSKIKRKSTTQQVAQVPKRSKEISTEELITNEEENEGNKVVNILSIVEYFANIAMYLNVHEIFYLSSSCKKLSEMLYNDDCWHMISRFKVPHYQSMNLFTRNDWDWKAKYIHFISQRWGRHSKDYEISNEGMTVTKIISKDRSNQHSVFAQYGWTTGKHYWEIQVDEFDGYAPYILIGIVPADGILDGQWIGWPGNGACYTSHGTYLTESRANGYGPSYGKGDTIGVLVDLDTSSIKFYKNGKDLGWAMKDFRNKSSVKWVDPVFPALGVPNQGNKLTANFRLPIPDH